ncbi:hypothetical protein X777_11812, partial [Ooceraea biroi]
LCERVLLCTERIEWGLSLIDRFKEGICLEWIGGMPMIFVFKPELVQYHSYMVAEKFRNGILVTYLIREQYIIVKADSMEYSRKKIKI